MKKVNQKKDVKESGLELPKLKKINQKGKEDAGAGKPAFQLKKVNRGKWKNDFFCANVFDYGD